MGETRAKHVRRTDLPVVSRAGEASAADILQRRLRSRVENQKQPLVRSAADQEARQRHLSDLRLQRGASAPTMDAFETAGDRSRRSTRVARGATEVGSRSHRSRRWRRRPMRTWKLPTTLPSMPCFRHARLAGAAKPETC